MFEPGQSSLTNIVLGRLAAAVLVAGLVAPVTALADDAFTRTKASGELEWGPCPEFMPEGCALTVLQGDPTQRNADVFFRLPAGSTAPLHWHSSAERMVLVNGEMEVAYEGQDPVVLKKGTYAYGPPRVPHVATCNSREDCVLFIAFEEPVDAVAAEE